jgi:hypothetical protein
MEQNAQSNPLAGLHKQKLYCLIAAGVGLIALLLPWITIGGFAYRKGFDSWGFLAVAGVAGVIAASFLGDKTKPYEGQFKQIALGSFAAIALAGVITFLTKNSIGGGRRGIGYGDIEVNMGRFIKPGFGVWLAILVGVAGVLFLMGIIKIPDNKPKA